MRRRVIALLLSVSLLLIPIFAALSQDESPAAKLDLTGVNPNELPTLILTTNVTNRTGQPVSDLGMNDFTLGGPLAERAEIVDVENITDDNLAFAAVLVIDTSSSMAGQPFEQAKAAARAFVNALGPNDPIALITFDSDERLVQDYTTDKQILLESIDALTFGGQTALYDGVGLGIETAARAPLPRRAVVILSDGAEYGGISDAEREDGLQMALNRGVPVFTVGLGFGIDDRYLNEIATGSNAAYYRLPDPESLPEIYRGLAQNFRNQYVITIELRDFDLQNELGQTTDFTLQANTPNGETNIVSSTVRVPVSAPIVTLPDDLFTNPLRESTEVVPTIVADDAITSIVFTTSEGSSEGDSFTIDPAAFAPGTYPLSVTVTDETGDASTITREFTIAALPSTITLNGLPDGTITEPITLTTTGEGQTPLDSVTYSFNGTDTTVTSDDDDFAFMLDPLTVAPGEYPLTVTATNEGGAETTVESTIVVGDVAPRIENIGIEDDQFIPETLTLEPVITAQKGKTLTPISLTIDGVEPVDLTIDPAQYAPGDYEVTLAVMDDAGQSAQASATITIAVIPPSISISAPELVSAEPAAASIHVTAQSEVQVTNFNYDFDHTLTQSGTFDAEGNAQIPIPAQELGNGSHTLVVLVSADGDEAVVISDVTFTIALPTATPTSTSWVAANTPSATSSPTETSTPTATLTSTPNLTSTADAVLNVTRTAAALSTRAALNTQAAETLVAVDTATSQAIATVGFAQTASARVTAEARRTQIAEANANAIQTATADAQGTLDILATRTALPGATETALIQQTATQLSLIAETQAAGTATESVTQTAAAPLTQTQANLATATGQALALVVTENARATQAAITPTLDEFELTATHFALDFLTQTQAAVTPTLDEFILTATQYVLEVTQTQEAKVFQTATRVAFNATFTQSGIETSTQASVLTATQVANIIRASTQSAIVTGTQAILQTATQEQANLSASGTAVIVQATDSAATEAAQIAQSTQNAVSTRQAATRNADVTSIANVGQTQAALTQTQNARATLTAQPTLTPTFGPTATQVPPLVELESEPSSIQGLLDSLRASPLAAVCIAIPCLLVIIVLFVLGGRRRRPRA